MNYQIIIDGEISNWGYSKTYMRNELAKFKGKHVDMRISSLGGDLGHGLDIRQQLIDHGDVTVYITGLTASAATVIAMGAKKICMSKYAFILVHKCSNIIDVLGRYNADEIQKLIEQLTANKKENDKIDVVLAQLYAERCGKKVSEILDLLKKGGWLTAQEALDWGLVDEIFEDANESKVNLTPELRQKFCAYALPFEGIERAAETADTSLLGKIYNMVRSIVHSTAQEPATVATTTDKAVYPAIMATIGVETMQVNADESVTMTKAQLETLDGLINNKTAEITLRDNTIKHLTEQVEALKKMPGDDTAGIVDDTAKGEMSSAEMYNLSKKFI